MFESCHPDHFILPKILVNQGFKNAVRAVFFAFWLRKKRSVPNSRTAPQRLAFRSRDDLTRTFPHDKQQGAKDYCTQLRAQQFRPRAVQLEDTVFVRVRDKGYKAQTATFEI